MSFNPREMIGKPNQLVIYKSSKYSKNMLDSWNVPFNDQSLGVCFQILEMFLLAIFSQYHGSE